jgi:HPt (histidine-containing phosphotransfer) domain-containing protein
MLFDTINKVCASDILVVTDETTPATIADDEHDSALLDHVRHIPPDLLEKLIQELPEHIVAIQHHLAQSDIAALRDRLHMFLGVCSYFGITDLEKAVRALQMAARSGDLTHVEAKLKKISSIIQCLEDEWHAEID